MRNKLLNNNQSDYISKGGVLYKPGEIPALTKEQLTQASLVSKLPRDFPFANWEGMTTKQQLQQMKPDIQRALSAVPQPSAPQVPAQAPAEAAVAGE